jgi:hypothetical protein
MARRDTNTTTHARCRACISIFDESGKVGIRPRRELSRGTVYAMRAEHHHERVGNGRGKPCRRHSGIGRRFHATRRSIVWVARSDTASNQNDASVKMVAWVGHSRVRFRASISFPKTIDSVGESSARRACPLRSVRNGSIASRRGNCFIRRLHHEKKDVVGDMKRRQSDGTSREAVGRVSYLSNERPPFNVSHTSTFLNPPRSNLAQAKTFPKATRWDGFASPICY